MKHLKPTLIYMLFVLFLGHIFIVNALEIGVDLAKLAPSDSSPTEAAPSTTPNPTSTGTVTPSVQPSPSSITPTSKPILSVSVSVSSPTASLSPTITASASPSLTEKPSKNTGGTNLEIGSPTPSPSISISPTATPTPQLSPTPTPTGVPSIISNIQPPVKSAAEKLYKNVLVPSLSFIFQRPKEDFYKDNQITRSTSYFLTAIATAGMLSGLAFLFPKQISRLYNRAKYSKAAFFSYPRQVLKT